MDFYQDRVGNRFLCQKLRRERLQRDLRCIGRTNFSQPRQPPSFGVRLQRALGNARRNEKQERLSRGIVGRTLTLLSSSITPMVNYALTLSPVPELP
jgi:hypothetical protein